MWQICQKRQFIPLLIEEGDFLPQDVKNRVNENAQNMAGSGWKLERE